MTASLDVSAPPSFHSVRWVVGLYRSDGTAVDTRRSANIAISDGNAEQTIAWPALPDGYYVARATVVGTDGMQDGSSVTELFLEVHGGDIDVLENTDWLTRSGAIDARPSLPDSRPGHE